MLFVGLPEGPRMELKLRSQALWNVSLILEGEGG